uniref:DEK-C domain-containing protein n=1 Tax=Setaria viridis TaxID=4556 RepID=A0A4U6T223_SETVI|nr:hypothetical protein SEVIR_9G371300v2 [Setaria viridis]
MKNSKILAAVCLCLCGVASETKSIKQPTWVFVEKESVHDLREQILLLTGNVCHEEEEILRADLLEKLNRCKRDTLIELCRSFDVIGSRANRKEELVSFLMEFVKGHCSGIDGTNSDKKIKKKRRTKEEESLSGGKPSKKKKREGEEEADGRNGVEDREKYFDCDLMDNRYICADNKKGKFPKERTNLEPAERINGCVSEDLDGVSLSEVPNPTDEAMITTPSKKSVKIADGDSTDMKAFKKTSSITKKKATPKEDCKVKSCGKQESKGDTKPRKLTMKPSKDELREAVFLILDTADFATMTFGDVVKEVDKYFGKDLFERKPLIRSLIEEELFRLTEEAEKKELEEEEVAEAKARAEQAAKETAQVRTVESGIDKRNALQAGSDGKTKDSSKDTNDSPNEKGINGGASVKSAVKRNNSNAAEGSQDHKANADTQNEDIHDELTKDGEGEQAAPIVNGDSAIQGSSDDEAETMKNSNAQALEGSKNDNVKGASNGENNVTEDCRNEEGRGQNVGSNAETGNGCEAEEFNNRGNDGCAEHTDGKAQEANHNENSANVEIHGDKDGKVKEGDINAEQSQADAGGNGKAEDADHNANAKVDVDSVKNGAAENGRTDGDVKGNSDSAVEESPV